MGCCNNTAYGPAFHRYFNSIPTEDLITIGTSNPDPYSINDPITIIENISLNPLGLAIYYNNVSRFKNLKQLGAKVSSLEDLLAIQGLSSFHIILKKGHQEMLEYYLPVFLLEIHEINESSSLNKPVILVAVRSGHLKSVKFLYYYFLDVVPPVAFDIHAVDHLGDNSANIACRNNDLEMVKFLHQICGVDFSVKNKSGKSALEVVRESGDGSELFRYFMENVNFDQKESYSGFKNEESVLNISLSIMKNEKSDNDLFFYE